MQGEVEQSNMIIRDCIGGFVLKEYDCIIEKESAFLACPGCCILSSKN